MVLGKTKSTVKVGFLEYCVTTPRSTSRCLTAVHFSAKSTTGTRGACEKALLEGLLSECLKRGLGKRGALHGGFGGELFQYHWAQC